MAFNKEILDILVCPKCKGELELKPAEDGLVCRKCELVYSINDMGIPCMLIDQAQPLKEEFQGETTSSSADTDREPKRDVEEHASSEATVEKKEEKSEENAQSGPA